VAVLGAVGDVVTASCDEAGTWTVTVVAGTAPTYMAVIRDAQGDPLGDADDNVIPEV
jgi:pyrroline-5-carboxylate reductase